MEISLLVAALKDPSIYPDGPSEILITETHISYLFFTGKYAYKLKKPVDFGFLDFTTLEKRGYFCNREVLLNNRFSHGVYLGVEEIREEDGRISFGGKGELVDYVVKMRQLPEEGMLGNLVSKGLPCSEVMDKLARRLAAFHNETVSSPEIIAYGEISSVRKNIFENILQTTPFIGRTLFTEQYDFISSKADGFIDNNRRLFINRQRDQRIRDCHGDLHLGSVCLDGDIIQIFDCIEFNERFRYIDTCSDISFLAMDLEFNGRYDLSSIFVDSYVRYSHDEDLPLLLKFYKSYRAYVRGKVSSFMLDEKEVPDDRKKIAFSSAERYFGLAYSYFQPPTLIITAGLMGTGKSTLARLLGQATGAEVIRSDEVRKGLAGISPDEHRYGRYEDGIYTSSFSASTYQKLREDASSLLSAGRSVIVDASFKNRNERARAASIAHSLGSRFFIIECICNESLTMERLRDRMVKGDISDGRPEIFRRQREEFEDITEDEGRLIRLDTSIPTRQSLSLALKIIGK